MSSDLYSAGLPLNGDDLPGVPDPANVAPVQDLPFLGAGVLGACMPLYSALQSSSQSLCVGTDSEH